MGGTVRTNITFGHRFDEEFYNIVIEACALKEDLNILPQGDATEVGEKGISLVRFSAFFATVLFRTLSALADSRLSINLRSPEVKKPE